MSVGILLAMFGETRMVVVLSCMLVCDEAFGTLGGWGPEVERVQKYSTQVKVPLHY